MTKAPPRVFISYSHDSDGHRDRVLDLADRLRADGIDAMIDQYIQSPPEGWPAWCDAEIEKANFVLMVCTEIYLRRVRRNEEPGVGRGVLWEGRLIYQHVYDASSVSTKFVPVLLADGSDANGSGAGKGRDHLQRRSIGRLRRLTKVANGPAADANAGPRTAEIFAASGETTTRRQVCGVL